MKKVDISFEAFEDNFDKEILNELIVEHMAKDDPKTLEDCIEVFGKESGCKVAKDLIEK